MRGRVTPPMRPLKRRQFVHEAVQEEIKSYILEHALKAGDALPTELDLARQLGVGRNSVREATKALEVLGVLEVRLGSGLFVRGFSLEPLLDNLPYAIQSDLRTLADLVEIRFHLENGMAGRVIGGVTDAQAAELRVILHNMRDHARRGMYAADDDRRFHEHLYLNAGNPLLVRILDVFWAVSHRVRDAAALPGPRNPLETYRRHVPILEALEARDTDLLRQAIVRHYAGIESRLLESGIDIRDRVADGLQAGGTPRASVTDIARQ